MDKSCIVTVGSGAGFNRLVVDVSVMVFIFVIFGFSTSSAKVCNMASFSKGFSLVNIA